MYHFETLTNLINIIKIEKFKVALILNDVDKLVKTLELYDW